MAGYIPPQGIHQVDLPAPPTGAGRLAVADRAFAAGDTSLLNGCARVAVIGSRSASEDGLRRAAAVAGVLARLSVVVVSGLARGVDTSAHTAAIQRGGRTIAVLGTPLDRVYPAENAPLQELIYRDHLLLSQFPAGARVSPRNFPQRNRTMALISHATIVVESGDSSGTLSQASETMRLGRKLLILRSALKPGLQWPERFLEQGAAVIDDAASLVRVLNDAHAQGIFPRLLPAEPPPTEG